MHHGQHKGNVVFQLLDYNQLSAIASVSTLWIQPKASSELSCKHLLPAHFSCCCKTVKLGRADWEGWGTRAGWPAPVSSAGRAEARPSRKLRNVILWCGFGDEGE